MSTPWLFMGLDRSHFSAKLRPALRYKQLHYVEIAPDVREIARRTGVSFVPALVTPEDEMLQDTTDILDALEARLPEPRLLPASRDFVLCRLFELYADEFFPIVSMRTRWAYPENQAEVRRAFAAFSGSLETGDRAADLMSSYLPRLGITAETIPAIDAHLDAMLAALCAHFRAHPFLLGGRMSLADCALMGPLYAHLHLDRVTRAKLYDEAIEVCMWIERCNHPVPGAKGDWFAGGYPGSLGEVLRLIAEDAAPVLLDLERAFETWAETNATAGMEPPRAIGPYTSELRGVKLEARVRAYVSWKLQRLREAFAALDGAEQDALRAWVPSDDWDRLLSKPTMARLEKRDFKLVFA